MGSITDSLTSVGDLYPTAKMRWHNGVHNYTTCTTGDVGAYDARRLANLGIGPTEPPTPTWSAISGRFKSFI
jgi:hypothetical protein